MKVGTRTLLGALLALCTISMTGCGAIEIFANRCVIGEVDFFCNTGVEIKTLNSTPVTASQLYAFDAHAASADLSGGNVQILSNTSTATVTLGVNGTTYASNTFTLVSTGTELRAAHPDLVNNWLRANAVNADSVTLDIDGVQVGEVVGTNVYTIVLEYFGSEVSGASYSWYMPDPIQRGYLYEK